MLTTLIFTSGIANNNADTQMAIRAVFMLFAVLNFLDFSGKQITIYLQIANTDYKFSKSTL